MKARGGKFLLILGAGLAAMAFVVVYIVMSKGVAANRAAAVPTAVPMVTIAVASADVPAYTMLDATNVATADVESTTVVSGTAESPATLFGKMTLVPLSKGQAITDNQVAKSGFSTVLQKGQRGFALAVPEKSTFGNGLVEGDRIDVLWTAGLKVDFKVAPDGKVDNQPWVYTSTKTLIQDVKVVRVINLRAPAPRAASSGEAQPAATGRAPAVVSASTLYEDAAPFQEVLILAVSDQQAEVLAYARQNGWLDLTLRSSAEQRDADGKVVKSPDGKVVSGDHDVEKTTGVTINTLIEQYGLLPAPAQGK